MWESTKSPAAAPDAFDTSAPVVPLGADDTVVLPAETAVEPEVCTHPTFRIISKKLPKNIFTNSLLFLKNSEK